MRRLISLVALVVGLVIFSSACATKSASPTGAPIVGVNHPTATAAASASLEIVPTDAAPSATSGTATFGQSYTYDDGLQITVSKPVPFQPSQSAAGGGAANVLFTITIVNGTTANFDPSLFNTTAQSGNTEASEIFDSDHGLDGSPSTALLPSRESKFKIGYGVDDPKDIVLEVTPGLDYDPAIFTS